MNLKSPVFLMDLRAALRTFLRSSHRLLRWLFIIVVVLLLGT